MILLIDNYDSFVHNLGRYFRQLGCETLTLRNDAVDGTAIRKLDPAAIVISPGPCTPEQAGYSVDCVREFAATIPILGVCLGHQAIVVAFGGEVVPSGQPMHGRQSEILHSGTCLFENLESPLKVGRYHSLIATRTSLPDGLRVTARLEDGTVMALQHTEHPVFGVQFHPESILTEGGHQMLANFCAVAGMEHAKSVYQDTQPRP